VILVKYEELYEKLYEESLYEESILRVYNCGMKTKSYMHECRVF